MNKTVLYDLLNNSPYPWVRYNTKRHLLHLSDSNEHVKTTYQEIVRHPLVQGEIKKCREWPEPSLKSHKAAVHPIHHLRVLADLGLSITTPGLRGIVNKIISKQGEDGALRSLQTLPKMWGGSDKPEWLWMYCDAPVLLHACLALGVSENDPAMVAARSHLITLHKEKGFLCASSLKKLRGPGRKNDPCPYAALLALRAAALFKDSHTLDICSEGTDILLSHWENRIKIKLRMFGIGTDFIKLKYPFVFYDLLHVVDVLSYFPWVWKDTRFIEMVNKIESQRDTDGLFTPESVWMAFKGFDFSQKKEPSHTLTYIVENILQRKYRHDKIS